MVKRQIIPEWPRALKLLARSANGCTQERLTDATIRDLVDAGLVAATTKRVLAGQRNGDVTLLMITGRGRAALETVPAPTVPTADSR